MFAIVKAMLLYNRLKNRQINKQSKMMLVMVNNHKINNNKVNNQTMKQEKSRLLSHKEKLIKT